MSTLDQAVQNSGNEAAQNSESNLIRNSAVVGASLLGADAGDIKSGMSAVNAGKDFLENIGGIENLSADKVLGAITDPSGAGIQQIASMLGLTFTTSKITMDFAPTRAYQPKPAAIGTVTLNGGATAIASVSLDSGGYGYFEDPTITVSGGGAILSANLSNGVISSISIVDSGSYSGTPPTVTISAPAFDSDAYTFSTPSVITNNSTGSLISLILAITGLGRRILSGDLTGWNNILHATADAAGVSGISDTVTGAFNTFKNGPQGLLDSLTNLASDLQFNASAADLLDTYAQSILNGQPTIDFSNTTGLLGGILGQTTEEAQQTLDAWRQAGTLEDNLRDQIAAINSRINNAISNTVPGVGAGQQEANRNNPNRTTETLTPETLVTITESIASQLDTSQSVFNTPIELGAAANSWGQADYVFTTINSEEELKAEMVSFDKDEINRCIVHWTDSFVNADLDAHDIDAAHKDLGHDGILYHYIIKRNGVLQRGRPPELFSNTAELIPDLRSLSIAFVGGYNCPTGTPDPERFRTVRSLTRTQFNTFETFVRALKTKYPGMRILGHNAIDVNQPDPGFDVEEYCNNLLNRGAIS